MLLSIVYMILFISMSCNKDDASPGNGNGQDNPTSGEWLIPDDKVFDGGPGKDEIPALSNPQFTDPQEATYLSDNDLVLGFVHDGVARAYPHNILDWHEIVNDSCDDLHMAIIRQAVRLSSLSTMKILVCTERRGFWGF